MHYRKASKWPTAAFLDFLHSMPSAVNLNTRLPAHEGLATGMPAAMDRNPRPLPQHVRFSRRTAVQAGAIGLLNLGMNHVDGLRALAAPAEAARTAAPKAKAVIYIFLSGGLAQHDSFDMKPDAPDTIRGEFKPIATRTPGHPDLRAPAAAGRAQPDVGPGAVAGPSAIPTTRPGIC